MPLALTSARRLDEPRQRNLCRYYLAAGAGGLAVGVHTTQFAIREPRHGLYRPVLALAAEEMARHESSGKIPCRIAGICGPTLQAVAEASLACDLGYHAGLLNLAALRDAPDDVLMAHCRAVAEVLPLVGFYLQPVVGGRVLSYRFWLQFVEIDHVVAIKVAPFNRYQTLDVVRALAESGRDDIALYTGNDDHIILDLITPFRFHGDGRPVERRFVGGLLGQWAVWTRRAVELLDECHALARSGSAVPADLLRRAVELTDANAAIFDAAHGYAGCIPGIHEVLRRQGLLEGTWCLDPQEALSLGQAEEIERVCRAYPHLTDDEFVARL
jgi:dihydrodipicolinate synthase/N-acetylneuraminate lyase